MSDVFGAGSADILEMSVEPVASSAGLTAQSTGLAAGPAAGCSPSTGLRAVPADIEQEAAEHAPGSTGRERGAAAYPSGSTEGAAVPAGPAEVFVAPAENAAYMISTPSNNPSGYCGGEGRCISSRAMERLCGLAIGILLVGSPYKSLDCCIYRGSRRMLRVTLSPCRVQAGRARKACAPERWVRGECGFIRSTPPPIEPDAYAWFGWTAAPLRGGGCNGLDFPQGLAGQLRCRLLLRRTRALVVAAPLRWAMKTGVAKARGLLPGERLVPPAEWTLQAPEATDVTTRQSDDGRFIIVNATVGCPAVHGQVPALVRG